MLVFFFSSCALSVVLGLQTLTNNGQINVGYTAGLCIAFPCVCVCVGLGVEVFGCVGGCVTPGV